MVKEVNHEELETAIRRGYETNRSLHTWGTIGIGKSQTVKRVASELAEEKDKEFVEWNEVGKEKKNEIIENPDDHFVFIDIRLAEFDPSDIKGIPNLEKNGAVEWKPPLWVYYISREKAKGVVFFDEINLAQPSVQSAFYQLIDDDQVSELSVSDGVYAISAGNREGKDRANVYELSAPLRDRFAQVELEIPKAGAKGNWTNWAMENDVNEKIIAFLSSPLGSDKLFTFNERKDAKVFATPRAWGEFANDLIEDVEDKDKIELLLSSVVGEGVASEFRGFLEMREDVVLDELIENPEMIQEISDVDKRYSVITGLASEYKQDTDTLKPLVKIANVMHSNGGAEFGILLLRLAKTKHPKHFVKKIKKLDEWDNLSQDFAKYLLK